MPRMPAQRSTRGFSLMELLIVLAVLAILAALLFPVFSSARKRAQDTACIANLQQLGHAMTMYVSDYDGAYPFYAEGMIYNNTVGKGVRIWNDMLKPYLKGSSPACPVSDWDNTPEDAYRTGYIINGRLNRRIGPSLRHSVHGRQETIVMYPSCTIILADARIGMIAASGPDTAMTKTELDKYLAHTTDAAFAEYIMEQEPGGIRHHGGADYAFADGHVKWLLPTSVRTDRKSDGIVPGFGL